LAAVIFEASETDSLAIDFTIDADLSDIDQQALGVQIGNAACDDAGLPHNACVVTFAAGSVEVTLVMYAVDVTLSSIHSVADASFGDATAMQTFLQTATGRVFAVSGYVATTSAGSDSKKKSSGILMGQGIAVVAGACAGIALVLLALVGGIWFMMKRRGGKVASAGPDASYTSGTKTEPPDLTDVDRLTS